MANTSKGRGLSDGAHDVLGPLSVLLCDLLCLDGRSVLLTEAELGDRDVLKQDVEVCRALL